jgi:hypothetical protein
LGDDSESALVHAFGHGADALPNRGEGALEPLPGRTVLTGEFADETQLYGVLDRLRDFGIELESVNSVDGRRDGS